MDSKIPTNTDYASAAEILAGPGPFVLTSHANPDGDAIGSVLGLYQVLRERGVVASLFLPSPCPKNLSWLSDANLIQQWKGTDEQKRQLENSKTIVVLDLNSLDRLDDLGKAIKASSATILNIDHHVMPADFAHTQVIDTDASSTCALLIDIIGMNINADAAMCLYVGIMTDTGSFRFPRTTAKVMSLVSNLIARGADPVKCYENVYNTNSFERTQLLGASLAGLKLYHNGKLCVMTVSMADMEKYHSTVEDTEGFVHHTLSIEGVMMGVLLVEVPGTIKCSFRSKGDVYIRDLAASYGGGGHNYAAGARMHGVSLTQAIERITKDALPLVGQSGA